MPNWCVGTLKVRGDKENIKNFLLGALAPLNSTSAIASLLGGKEVPEHTVIVEEDDWEMTLKTEEGFHVKGSRRNFIESKEISWYLEDNVLIIYDYRAAWGIDTPALIKLSSEYGVDLKIYAFERGMEFNLDIEIHKGEIVKNNEIKFNDYKWECICPELGG